MNITPNIYDFGAKVCLQTICRENSFENFQEVKWLKEKLLSRMRHLLSPVFGEW